MPKSPQKNLNPTRGMGIMAEGAFAAIATRSRRSDEWESPYRAIDSSCDNLQSPGCPPLHHSFQVIVFDLPRATLRRMAPQKPLPAGSADVPPALLRQLIDDLNDLARPLDHEDLPSGRDASLHAG